MWRGTVKPSQRISSCCSDIRFERLRKTLKCFGTVCVPAETLTLDPLQLQVTDSIPRR